MASVDSALLRATNVTKVFRRPGRAAFTALSDVNLEVGGGGFTCLIGPSGCGKSTLLSLFAGLSSATEGQLTFRDKPIVDTDPERGMLFQQPALFPWLNVRDNVLFGPKAQRRCTEKTIESANNLLREVGLEAFAEAYPHELSGGMKHRAAFARALINQPALLLLDEPFAALDAITRTSMQQLLLDLWALHQMSIVFVTHDVSEAALLADKIVLMASLPGRIDSVVTNPVPRTERRDIDSIENAELRRSLRQRLAEIVAASLSGGEA